MNQYAEITCAITFRRFFGDNDNQVMKNAFVTGFKSGWNENKKKLKTNMTTPKIPENFNSFDKDKTAWCLGYKQGNNAVIEYNRSKKII